MKAYIVICHSPSYITVKGYPIEDVRAIWTFIAVRFGIAIADDAANWCRTAKDGDRYEAIGFGIEVEIT